ncbi:MAG: hypothetical protein QXS54_11035 [Candidatus Methanomethylicaceae archaeon]
MSHDEPEKKKVVIKHLTPELLNDDALNRADWVVRLHKVVVSSGGIAAVVGEVHCLVHDLEHHRWYHYQLPEKGSSWALAQDSACLWGLVGNGKLTRLNLRSGEWIAFQHHINYESILYAEDDVVIAQCGDILSIDMLRLENDGLQRIVSIPLKFDFSPTEISSAFLPEENQFIIIGHEFDGYRYVLCRLDWNGESNLVLDVEGDYEGRYWSLHPPFFVMVDKERENLIYADLRENPVKPRYVNFDSCFKHGSSVYHWHKAFVFDNSSIVALSLDERLAIIRLGEEEKPEILYDKCKSEEFKNTFSVSDLCLLGRFLTLGSERWVYDLVTRRASRDVPWSTLLRQAIQDEVERQQAASATITPMLTRTQERSDIDAFKVFLSTSQYRIAEIESKLLWDVFSKNAISSSRHSAIFLLDRVPSVYWLPRGTDQLRHLLPEIEYRWARFTFDEQDRIWACDRFGKYIAVVHPDQQEGQGFVVPRRLSFPVQAIAACDNTIAVASSDQLAVYHYDEAEGMLKEMLHWKSGASEDEIVGIKPDIEEQGLWVVTYSYSLHRSALKYLPLDGKVSAPRKVEEINQLTSIRILGDWPERVYFAYIDHKEHVLHYTLNPEEGWHQVPLRHLVQKRSSYRYPYPVSMSSDGDVIFTLVCADNDYLLVRLQSGNAELISAFETKYKMIQFARWGDWLVLCSEKPPVFARAYANRAEITELPENKGVLFFHLPTNQFYAKPYQPYAITDALRRMLSSGARGFLKSPL